MNLDEQNILSELVGIKHELQEIGAQFAALENEIKYIDNKIESLKDEFDKDKISFQKN